LKIAAYRLQIAEIEAEINIYNIFLINNIRRGTLFKYLIPEI